MAKRGKVWKVIVPLSSKEYAAGNPQRLRATSFSWFQGFALCNQILSLDCGGELGLHRS